MNEKLFKVRNLFHGAMQTKQDVMATFEGDLGDGNGNVRLTALGMENFAYVRINGIIQEVFNTRVPMQEGLKVIVGFDPSDPELLQILGTRTSTPFGTTGRSVTDFAPASYYQWLGVDPVWIAKRVWLPRRISVIATTDPAYTGFTVRFFSDMFWNGTEWTELASSDINLVSYVPSTAGKAVYVLITLNAAGTPVCTPGVEVSTTDLEFDDIPSVPAGTSDVLAAVSLYHEMTAIVETVSGSNIVDLRFTYSTASGGKSVSNLLINGGFERFSRGAVSSPATMTDGGFDGPDRWFSLIQGTGATIQQVSDDD